MNWWAIQHRHTAQNLSGKTMTWFEGGIRINQPYRVFTTKKEAELYIRNEHGYIAKRQDLRTFPHGWRMPKAVRVAVDLRPV